MESKKGNNMKTFLRYLPYFYLGGALAGFTNIDPYQWEFYAIVIPMAILIGMSEYVND